MSPVRSLVLVAVLALSCSSIARAERFDLETATIADITAAIDAGALSSERVGLQFFGRSFDDLRVLKIAYGYEHVSKKRRSPASTPALPGESFEYEPPNDAIRLTSR